MADLKRIGRFLFCVMGVWGSFFIWGLLQERITTKPYEVDGKMQVFRSPFVIVLMQAVLSLIVSSTSWLLPIFFSSNHPEGGEMTLPAAEETKKLNASDATNDSVATTISSKHSHHKHHHHHHKSRKLTVSRLLNSLCDWSKFTPSLWRSVASIGFTMTFGAPFGYAAIRAGMPYPIMLTVKLGKMIPIVVVSTLVHRIRYPPIKYAITALITAGVVWFSFEDESGGSGGHGGGAMKSSSSKSSAAAEYAPIFGTMLVIINLFMDGFTASSQDILIKTMHMHGNTLQLLSNLSCAVWTLAALITFEFMPENKYTAAELSSAIHFFQAAPTAFYEVVLMSLLNAVGQVFIFQTISHFGTLTLTAITVTRKTGSVFLSIFINGHVLKFNQFCAMGLVLAGVGLETYDSVKSKSKHGKHHHGGAPKAVEGAAANAKKVV